MSETTTDNTTHEGAAPTSASEATPSSDDSEERSGSKLHREAANYRTQRNEAREERDALAQRVKQMQTREVERLAAASLSQPGDLFSLSGNELADYLTEDGDVDGEKVAADVAAILAERPGLQKPKHVAGYDPTQGRGGRPPKGSPSFGDLLKL